MESRRDERKEYSPNFINLAKVVRRRLQNEGCTILADNLTELSYSYLKVIQNIAKKLNATPFGIGSTFNNFDSILTSGKASDIDFTFMPKDKPSIVQRKLINSLKKLPEMPKRDHDTDVEAGRRYKAYDVHGNGRIALVISVNKEDKPVLGSLRLIDMNMRFPWTTTLDRRHIKHKMEGNPTTKNPIVDIGFPPYDKELKMWLDPKKFNPSQEKVGVLIDDDVVIQTCDHSQTGDLFPKLTPKSQAIIAIRSSGIGLEIPSQIILNSFKEVAPESYSFIYNLVPSIERVSIDNLTKLLVNHNFMERVIKFSFPYMHMVLTMIKRGGDLKTRFDNVIKKRNNVNLLQLISLSAQDTHISGDPNNGRRRDEAARIGRTIEINIFDYDANIEAFDKIINQVD
jgi:hypothetical protein